MERNADKNVGVLFLYLKSNLPPVADEMFQQGFSRLFFVLYLSQAKKKIDYAYYTHSGDNLSCNKAIAC